MRLGGLSCHANTWEVDKAVIPNSPSMESGLLKIAHPPVLWLYSGHLGECAHGFPMSVYLDQPGPVRVLCLQGAQLSGSPPSTVWPPEPNRERSSAAIQALANPPALHRPSSNGRPQHCSTDAVTVTTLQKFLSEGSAVLSENDAPRTGPRRSFPSTERGRETFSWELWGDHEPVPMRWSSLPAVTGSLPSSGRRVGVPGPCACEGKSP